jgi:hypothetical protein
VRGQMIEKEGLVQASEATEAAVPSHSRFDLDEEPGFA